MPPVTLLTDFGTVDGYVGEMKGVLISSGAEPLVDVTHRIRPGDVRGGAWALRRIWDRFPPETVHLAVVDPGVGSDRRAVAVRAADRWFVGPDNGLLTWVGLSHDLTRAISLNPRRVGAGRSSDTFHGRDVFAPAAGVLATGGLPADLGRPVDPASLVSMDIPSAERSDDGISGAVWHVDRYGNLVTNVPVEWLPEEPVVELDGRRIRGLASAFVEVDPGELLLTRGSLDTLEVSARGASAAEILDVGRDARLRVARDS
jgi:S-adenosylmethionine hydrolase